MKTGMQYDCHPNLGRPKTAGDRRMFGYLLKDPQTVRPRSAGWTLAPLCLAVFCLTAVIVYCWGEESQV